MRDPRQQAYHNLAVMLDAGLPIGRALRTAARGTRGRMGRALQNLAEAVSGGQALSQAMAAEGRTFDNLELATVRAAETSGSLAEMFKLMGQWRDFRQRIRQVFTSGMLLPVLMLHAAAVLIPFPGLVLGGWNIPRYLMQALGILAVLYVPAGIIAAVIVLTPRDGLARRALDALIVHVPVLGRGVRQLALARFCRAFQVLYGAGVPIVECLRQSCAAVGNSAVAALLSGSIEAARAGRAASEGFSPRLPDEFLQVWQVGEEAGKLEEVTDRLASAAEEASQRTFAALARWLPRLIYLLVMLMMAAAVVSGWSRIMGSVDLGL